MVDLSALQYTLVEQAWAMSSADDRYLIIVSGTLDGPEPESLELARKILGDIEPYRDAAVKYLNSWLSATGRADEADWNLNQVEFGRTGGEPSKQFVMFFDHDIDEYAWWHVIFHFAPHHHTSFVPKEFGRRED